MSTSSKREIYDDDESAPNEMRSILDVRQAVSSHLVRWITVVPVVIAMVVILISLYVKPLYSFNLIIFLFIWVIMIFWFFMVAVVYNAVMNNKNKRIGKQINENTPSTQATSAYANSSYNQLSKMGHRRSDRDRHRSERRRPR
jgi:glucan phosphoethanolaminetransferase (alkaline phosphatase superfamily)